MKDPKLSYLLPAICKGLNRVTGHPFISNYGTKAKRISESFHLNEVVSFNRALPKLRKIPEERALLSTVEVVGLYTRIPDGQGLQATIIIFIKLWQRLFLPDLVALIKPFMSKRMLVKIFHPFIYNYSYRIFRVCVSLHYFSTPSLL